MARVRAGINWPGKEIPPSNIDTKRGETHQGKSHNHTSQVWQSRDSGLLLTLSTFCPDVGVFLTGALFQGEVEVSSSLSTFNDNICNSIKLCNNVTAAKNYLGGEFQTENTNRNTQNQNMSQNNFFFKIILILTKYSPIRPVESIPQKENTFSNHFFFIVGFSREPGRTKQPSWISHSPDCLIHSYCYRIRMATV